MNNKTFIFPKPKELTLRLKDMLEIDVDEKYYLTEKISNLSKKKKTPMTMSNNTIEPIVCEQRYDEGLVYSPDGLCPTINTMQGGHRQPKIVEPTNKLIKVADLKTTYEQSGRVYSPEGVSPTIMSNSHGKSNGGYTSPKIVEPQTIIDDTQGFDGTRYYKEYSPSLRASRSGLKTTDGIRVRKLTPKECWRLMGFDDVSFERAEKVNSNTQLYKQAGNSIVVNVLEEIFKNLLKENEYEE